MINNNDISAGASALYSIVNEIAVEENIKLSKIQFDDGRLLNCKDSHLLQMTARGKSVSVKISYKDLLSLPGKPISDTTLARIRSAVELLRQHLDS